MEERLSLSLSKTGARCTRNPPVELQPIYIHHEKAPQPDWSIINHAPDLRKKP
jgi:hypothetical protein